LGGIANTKRPGKRHAQRLVSLEHVSLKHAQTLKKRAIESII
jgi:hypothetical protein